MIKLETQPNLQIFPLKMEKKREMSNNKRETSNIEVAKLAVAIFSVAIPAYLFYKKFFADFTDFAQVLEEDPLRASQLIYDCISHKSERATNNKFNRDFLTNGDCISIANQNLKKIAEKTPKSLELMGLSCLKKSTKESLTCKSILKNMVPLLMESASESTFSPATTMCTIERNPDCLPAIQKYLPNMIELNPFYALSTVTGCFNPHGQGTPVGPKCESIVRDAFPLLFAKNINATAELSLRCIEKDDPLCKSLLKDYVPEIIKNSPEYAHPLASACRPYKDPICQDIIKQVFPHMRTSGLCSFFSAFC
jgi:hypothetical protein